MLGLLLLVGLLVPPLALAGEADLAEERAPAPPVLGTALLAGGLFLGGAAAYNLTQAGAAERAASLEADPVRAEALRVDEARPRRWIAGGEFAAALTLLGSGGFLWVRSAAEAEATGLSFSMAPGGIEVAGRW
jgi:hypothetical protein